MILIDGTAQSTISAQNRGLHYGDGIFETLAVIGNRIRNQARHWARLTEGCTRLGLSLPDTNVLEREVQQLCHDSERAVVKLMVVRGGEKRGYRCDPEAPTQRIVIRENWPEHPPQWRDHGVRIRWCATRLSRNPALAGIKHCNRLEQILARQEWEDEHEEGLMQNEEGNVIEGTMSNVFLLRGQCLTTPSLDSCGVDGVTRQRIIEEAPALGLEVDVRAVACEEFRAAESILLCNAIIGVWSVRQLEEQEYVLPTVLTELRRRIEAI